jgi:hypothetical protein
MHPELRRARALYYEWRQLPERERDELAPFALDVKELALDLRGHADYSEAEIELRQANDTLAAVLRYATKRAA